MIGRLFSNGAASLRKLSSSVREGMDWASVIGRCQPEARQTIVELRTRHNELWRLLSEAESATRPIDFASYRERIRKAYDDIDESGDAAFQDLAFVDKAEFELSNYAVSNESIVAEQQTSLEAERQKKMEETERFLQGVEKDIVCLRERLAQIDSRPPVEEMTVDDFYEMYPEQRTLFYDSLRNEDWSSTARPT